VVLAETFVKGGNRPFFQPQYFQKGVFVLGGSLETYKIGDAFLDVHFGESLNPSLFLAIQAIAPRPLMISLNPNYSIAFY
jgi:hypothetical protein